MSDAHVAITTGANSGIGLATVLELARRGFRSVGTVRSDAKAAVVAEAARNVGVSVDTVVLDVTDPDGCARVIDAYRPFALVNNAGYSVTGAIEDVDDDEARAAFETMVLAPMRLALARDPAHARTRRTHRQRLFDLRSRIDTAGRLVPGCQAGAGRALRRAADGGRGEGIHVVLVEPGGFRTGIWDETEHEIAKRSGSRYDAAYRRVLDDDQVVATPHG